MSIAVSKPWRPTKLKFAARVVAGGTPESGNPEYWDGSVPWLTPVDLGNEHNDAITISKRTLSEAGVMAAGLERLPSGSVVISTRAPIGSVGLLACEAVTNQGCKALVLDNRALESRFSFYLALDSAKTLQSLGLGTTFAELSTYALKNLAVSLPSPAEQRRIAGYLDEATGKVDRLVALRRRQMELLREQRAALIQQAVTRGLNPNAPLKDSGLPWLGQIPKSWTVTKLKRVCFYQEGPGLRHWQFTDSGVRVICVTNITEGGVTFDDYQRWISAEEYQSTYKHFTVQRGDLMLASSGNSWGKVAEYDSDETVILNTSTMRLNASRYGRITKDFLRLLLAADYLKTQLLVLLTGSCQPNFGPSHLDRLTVAFPPTIQEQQKIVAIYQRESGQIDSLLSAYTRQLELLTEYRAALIHECVTGQRTVPPN